MECVVCAGDGFGASALSRREFAIGGGCFISGLLAASAGMPQDRPLLRLALMSDPHVDDRGSPSIGFLKSAFAFAAEREVDGVLIAGDVANNGRDSELKLVADAWFSVFPGGKNASGRPVKIYACYGNRDFRDSSITKPEEKAAEAAISIFSHPSASWERCFGEPIGDDFCMKEICGYKVVIAHWRHEQKVDAFFEKLRGRFAGTRRFSTCSIRTFRIRCSSIGSLRTTAPPLACFRRIRTRLRFQGILTAQSRMSMRFGAASSRRLPAVACSVRPEMAQVRSSARIASCRCFHSIGTKS